MISYFCSSDNQLTRDTFSIIYIIFDYVMRAFCPEQIAELSQTSWLINEMTQFNEDIKKVSETEQETVISDFKSSLNKSFGTTGISHPFKSGITLTMVDEIKIMKSNSKPLKVSFICVAENDTQHSKETIIFKFEDLIGDMAAESYIQCASFVFPSFGIISYKVIPYSPFVGMIETISFESSIFIFL